MREPWEIKRLAIENRLADLDALAGGILSIGVDDRDRHRTPCHRRASSPVLIAPPSPRFCVRGARPRPTRDSSANSSQSRAGVVGAAVVDEDCLAAALVQFLGQRVDDVRKRAGALVGGDDGGDFHGLRGNPYSRNSADEHLRRTDFFPRAPWDRRLPSRLRPPILARRR